MNTYPTISCILFLAYVIVGGVLMSVSGCCTSKDVCQVSTTLVGKYTGKIFSPAKSAVDKDGWILLSRTHSSSYLLPYSKKSPESSSLIINTKVYFEVQKINGLYYATNIDTIHIDNAKESLESNLKLHDVLEHDFDGQVHTKLHIKPDPMNGTSSSIGELLYRYEFVRSESTSPLPNFDNMQSETYWISKSLKDTIDLYVEDVYFGDFREGKLISLSKYHTHDGTVPAILNLDER